MAPRRGFFIEEDRGPMVPFFVLRGRVAGEATGDPGFARVGKCVTP
jgi:hypothetical protein